MNRLKQKASQLFKHGQSQDEEEANVSPVQEADLNTGTERKLRKKRWLHHLACGRQLTSTATAIFRKRSDKPLPAPPNADAVDEASAALAKGHAGECEMDFITNALDATAVTRRPAFAPTTVSPAHTTASEESSDDVRTTKQAEVVVKKRPSFASLRKSSMLNKSHRFHPYQRPAGSRIFRASSDDHEPPPPVPQIPAIIPTPRPRHTGLWPQGPARPARLPRADTGRVAISRPVASAQQAPLPPPAEVSVFSFTKPSGPPPPRPPRPGPIDMDIVAMQRDSSARVVLSSLPPARPPTASTTSSAAARLGPQRPSTTRPSYYPGRLTRLPRPSDVDPSLRVRSSTSTLRAPTFSPPLAATFPRDPRRPLPSRTADGSVTGYSRFSAYVMALEGYGRGGYPDDDAGNGPLELYDPERAADWTVERRMSVGPGGRGGGTLCRDRWGGFHYVPDV